jgi:hypothetical protein
MLKRGEVEVLDEDEKKAYQLSPNGTTAHAAFF